MITILYSESDYSAADIAIKVQAIAQGKGTKIYIVPKHYGRIEENVYKNLRKSTIVLFLAYDKTKIDNSTRKELEFLINKGKNIYSIIPVNMELPIINKSQNIKIIQYHKKGKIEFVNEIKNILSKLVLKNRSRQRDKDFIGLIGFLLISILLLELFPGSKK